MTKQQKLAASSRKRPKRQRTATTLYSDDNPSTFTIKKKKGEAPESPPPPKPSYYYVEESSPSPSPAKRTYVKTQHKRKDANVAAAAAAAAAAPLPVLPELPPEMSLPPEQLAALQLQLQQQPVKRKRGRPPSLKTKLERERKALEAAARAALAGNAQQQQDPSSEDVVEKVVAALQMTPTTTMTPATTSFVEPPPSSPEPSPEPSPPLPKRTSTTSATATTTTTTAGQPPTPLAYSYSHAVDDAMGTFLPHAVTLAPILPPTEHDKNPQRQRILPINEQRVNGIPTVNLDQPTWNPLYSPHVYFDDDYEADTNILDPETIPVTTSITCVTTRKPDHQYMAVGDAAGFCTIYTLKTHIRPVARLETVACQQRARPEQEKIRALQKRKKKLRSIVLDTSLTTIHALGFMEHRVVLATACEFECMDIPSQTSLWVCPLSTDRLVTSLDMHLQTKDVLVSCSLYPPEPTTSTDDDGSNNNNNNSPSKNQSSITPSSPLMLVQQSRNKVEICDANSPILLKSPSCTAIWDASKRGENRLLFVALSDDVGVQELELVLVQGGSIDKWKVACKTRIPVKSSNHETKLCQSPEGMYTVVASSRGIRLYQTETLQLIHVYGDQLALHGKSVVWQDCLLLGNFPKRSKHGKPRGNRIESDDWLAPPPPALLTDDDDYDDDDEGESSDLGPYVVGVPHHKGPKELCETLHVWKVERASTVPALSIPLPPKSDGVQGLVGAPSLGGMVLATRNGHGHMLLPNLKSNFAGIMYPPGYQVITDNLEFIEDEDQLDDHVVSENNNDEEEEDVDILEEEDIDDEMDEDLKEAMRQSLLEQKLYTKRQAVKDKDVDIFFSLNKHEMVESSSTPLIPCRPEAYLKQQVNTHKDDDDDDDDDNDEDLDDDEPQDHHHPHDHPVKKADHHPSSTPAVFVANVLDGMPNAYKPVVVEDENAITFTAKIVVASTNPISGGGRGRGKRSRAANLDSMLKASIDPYLQRLMISKQSAWADGKGSTYWRKTTATTSKNNDKDTTTTTTTNHPTLEKAKDADEEILKTTKEPVTTAAEQNSNHVTPSPTTSNEATEFDIPSEKKQSAETTDEKVNEEEKAVVDEQPIVKKATAQDDPSSAVLKAKETHQDLSSRMNGNSLSQTWSNNRVATPPLGALTTNIRPDEAAVALGLLGLSPCNAVAVETPIDPFNAGIPSEPKAVPGNDEGSFYSESLSRANLSAPRELVSDSTSRMSSANQNLSLNHVVYGSGTADSFHSSDRGSVNAGTASDEVVSSSILRKNPLFEAVKINMNCNACRGRHLIHSCGQRSLPIDFDEVAKAERDRKLKEEEEKKKERAEKRRMADARRREARKKKQQELEDRRRREEEMRLEDERMQRMETQRRDLIMASYATHVTSGPNEPQWSSQDRSVGLSTVDYGSQQVAHADERNESGRWERNETSTKDYGSAPHHNEYTNYESPAAATEKTDFASATSTTRLASADALLAFANIVGNSEQPESTALSEQPDNAYGANESSNQSYGASHGFDVSSSDVPKRGLIPSYADIHGHVNGDSASNSLVSYGVKSNLATSDLNGNHRTATSSSATTYVWPPRPEAERNVCADERAYVNQSDNTYQAGQDNRGNWPPS